ncbi:MULTISPECIES: methyl-accepting chemotaxis protein [Bradyrhizobium]|jgi:methyl-accepting chemotaxis protein|uniref:methyl-accepting chemotaxis protein n=2 Tax=Nitrobacteraceae TaxID=41294 RepID=UPI00039BF75C|nr:methyl-accepting chemotaxis protein [Bradyrhizobium denitrificans]MCL8482232.1 methyl-accepting chemotaxis protein [Bradyrhizobium denitrificans]
MCAEVTSPARSQVRFGLKGQILCLGVAGVAVIGCLYLAGLSIERRSQQVADRVGTLAALSGGVWEGLLQARGIATEFLQRPSDAKVATHEKIVTSVEAQIDRVDGILAAMPYDDTARQAASSREAIRGYATRFANVVAAQRIIGFDENDGLQGKLRGAVRSIETQLTKHDQPRLAVLMLMMRRHEKDFMLRGDPKYGDDLRKRVDEFGAELAKSNLSEAVRADIIKLMDVYRTSFLAYMAGQTKLLEEAAELTRHYEGISPSLQAIRSAADQRLGIVKAELASVKDYVFWSICITVLVAAVAALLFGRWLATPLLQMARAMERLAQNDLDVRLEPVKRRDEVGQISRALGIFHGKLLENRRLTEAQEKAKEEAERERRRMFAEMWELLETDLDCAVAEVMSISGDASTRSAQAVSEAKTIASEAGFVAQASARASSNVATVSSSAEELSATGREIAQRAAETAELASRAAREAQQAGSTVAALSDAAEQISSVVSTIAEVAAQTNLLALNATIEAARAGEAGAGFAIVAHEVKALARKTSEAADDIARRIERISNATSDSTAVISKISTAIGSIDGASAAMAAAAEQQEATLREVARSLTEASAGVASVAENVTRISGRSAEIEQQTQAVSELVNGTNGRVSELRANLMVSLRSSSVGDRRSSQQRRPMSLTGCLHGRGGRFDGSVLDLSEAGLRFRAGMDVVGLSEHQQVKVECAAFGAVEGDIVAIGNRDIHVSFGEHGMAQRDAVAAFLAEIDRADQANVQAALTIAGRIVAAIEQSIDCGESSIAQWFDFNYQRLPGTDPEQFEAPFTALCDRLLAPIQEAALASDPNAVFCAATDRNAYIPTHNRRVSQPQRPGDKAWNAANCRNRRFYKDRAGMAAARTLHQPLHSAMSATWEAGSRWC